MSSFGWQRARLEAQRREQLRLEQLRSQCSGLVTACRDRMVSVTQPAVQQLAAPGLKKVQRDLQAASRMIDASPDGAIGQIKKAQKALNRTIAQAEAKAHKWSKLQARSKAALEGVAQEVRAQKDSSTRSGDAVLAKVEEGIAQADSLHNAGRYEEAMAVCQRAKRLVQEAAEASLDETVRREVVRGLLVTLKDMGFVVKGPQFHADESDGGGVTMIGRLPSGKMARFDVHLDGRMKFDMDGYEGRSCGKELEKIRDSLRKRFSVKMTPRQVTWKNPDKISKGSLNLPSDRQARGPC